MKVTLFFDNYFKQIVNTIVQVDLGELNRVASCVWDAHKAGRKVIVVDNGGSAL